MEVMQFTTEEVHDVLRLLAGILHLGNIEFMTAGGAQVSFKTGKGNSFSFMDHIIVLSFQAKSISL